MKRLLWTLVLCLSANLIVFSGITRAQNEKKEETKAGAKLLRRKVNDVVVREVVGQGPNREEAIKQALNIAVGQARGVRVGSGSYEFAFDSAGVGIYYSSPDGRRIDFDRVKVATKGTLYTHGIEGLVADYKILEEKQLNEKTYEVKLRVLVYDYGTRGETRRVKVALMPVNTSQSSYRFLNLTVTGTELSGLFTHRLAVGLTETNKFAVLDRESIEAFAREHNILVALDAPLKEQAKLAETVGAEYLLVGTITQAKLEMLRRHLEVARYTTTEYKARFTFNYRLVDSITKEIVLASVETKYIENEQVRALADEPDPAQWDPAQIRDAFLSLVANEVIEAIIDRVYPIKIVSIQPDGTIILNQGGDRISKGMMFDVFSEGKEIFDPDTRESLGKVETQVATIRVQEVAHTMSFAKIVKGDLSRISKGFVCRAKELKKKREPGMKPVDIVRTREGGVKLPFDK